MSTLLRLHVRARRLAARTVATLTVLAQLAVLAVVAALAIEATQIIVAVVVVGIALLIALIFLDRFVEAWHKAGAQAAQRYRRLTRRPGKDF